MDRYSQNTINTNVHFSNALFGKVDSSRMTATPTRLTTFNAGELVPIYCREVLPGERLSISTDFVIRQTTLLTPTMGKMQVDLYAFFVPNRIVNQSWKAVEGENFNGSWTANPVSLAPLISPNATGAVQIPVGSVADYYDFPTQQPIPASVLQRCHDLKFRGYLMIWNEFFRDQNYQPPYPMSTLNVYQGFLDSVGSMIPLAGDGDVRIDSSTVPDGSFGSGSVARALYGSGFSSVGSDIASASGSLSFRAISPPLRVNKLHDYFTSVLPSPQKSQGSVFAPVVGSIGSVPVIASETANSSFSEKAPILFYQTNNDAAPTSNRLLGVLGGNGFSYLSGEGQATPIQGVYPANLKTDGDVQIDGLALSVDDIRMASAIQQVYETLARGGSRYRELVQSFFGIEVDDPFSDIPTCLGHISRDLDLYQTAQTAPSETGSTPQGNLAAFGYTSADGELFSSDFVEHGYVHIFAVVRHRNIYSSYLPRDNFRMNMLDFYTPPLANISEQPVYTREINPFASDPDGVFGYQEAWAEYRFEPDAVSGLMRPGVDGSLAIWNYADDFDSGISIANGDWLLSNSKAVLDRTLAVSSSVAPQLKGQFLFKVDKTLPMPTYSVPGMDII